MISFLLALWGLFFATRQAPCGEEHFVAHPNRSIQLGQIRPGSKLVFQYGCQTKGFRETIARDVGVRHVVAFEVDPESHAFFLEDEALQRAKVSLSRHCRCKPLAYDHLDGVRLSRRVTPSAGPPEPDMTLSHHPAPPWTGSLARSTSWTQEAW